MSLVETSIDAELGAGEIVLNRPEKLNAFNRELENDFFAALRQLSSDESVRCIVLAAAGRAFSAGYDLHELTADRSAGKHQSGYDDWYAFHHRLRRWRSVREADVPVVAAVHGYCFGIATLLVTMTDIVVIATDATWGAAQVRGGGGYNGATLAYIVGHRKAREIDFRSARLSGREAVDIGWANYAVPAADVLPRAREIARDIALTPRATLVTKKAQLNRLMDDQGFTRALDDGGLVHTVLDFTPGVDDMYASLHAGGVRQTVAKWT